MQGESWNNSDKNSSGKSTGVRVIGAGLPRTGTTSLKAALEILGFGPCHHMQELFKKPAQSLEFIRAYDGEEIDFHKLLEDYGSTIDAPTSDFFKEIHRAFPRAKIILTVRDNGERWFESFQNTIGVILRDRWYYYWVYLIRPLRLQRIVVDKVGEKWTRDFGEISPAMYDAYNARVINENQANKILVYNAKEGWAPLCKFLEVDIPKNIPFPNVNDTKQFKQKLAGAKRLGMCLWAVVGTIVVSAGYFALRQRTSLINPVSV